MTLQQIKGMKQNYSLPQQKRSDIAILLAAIPELQSVARAELFVTTFKARPEDLTNEEIIKYLTHKREYDSCEISWIVKELKKDGGTDN